MNTGKIVFSQLIDHLSLHNFRRCVERYRGDYKVQSFSCLDQYLCMAFAQLTYRESLRDIEARLRAQRAKLYHMGIRGNVSRSTLADANESRDWRIHADFAQAPIGIARRLYVDDAFGADLDDMRSTPPPSTSVSRSSRGRRSSAPTSSSIRCSICAATSRLSSISPGPGGTTPGGSTNSPQSPALVSCHGPRIYRLRPPPSSGPTRRLLRRPGARQRPLPQALFPRRRPANRPHLRPDHHNHRPAFRHRLPGQAAPHQGTATRRPARPSSS